MSGRISEGAREIGNIPQNWEFKTVRVGKQHRGQEVSMSHLERNSCLLARLPFHPSSAQRMDISERSIKRVSQIRHQDRHNKTLVIDSSSA